jgi:translation initiation factor IF-1
MAGKSAFQVEGVVVEALPNGTYWAELRNGHRVLAFVAGKAKQRVAAPAPGDVIRLQLSPYDLSQGRIIVQTHEKMSQL